MFYSVSFSPNVNSPLISDSCLYLGLCFFPRVKFGDVTFLWCVYFHSSNRVEAWTRDVPFLLRQEGRPVTDLVGDASTTRVMTKDWRTTDIATQWIRHKAAALSQPFALYLGLNLPHPYVTDSLGPNAGGSTFRTSPYWLEKARSLQELLLVPIYNFIAVMCHVSSLALF